MNNQLEMERIWQDDDFFELKITCVSKIITATTKVYTTNASVDNLTEKIKSFLSGDAEICLWENGEKGDGATAFISLEFSRKDKLGHVQIEVFMELDDGGKFRKHNCCFYVETELGLLEKFCKNIYKLKERQIGSKICLGQYT